MSINKRSQGFSLVELLLVLAIIGIISAIAIPSFLGQRKRARVIGDAQSNAKALAMMLESRKAEMGIYGASATQDWTASGAFPSASTSFAPSFTPQGNSKMNFRVAVAGGGLSYTMTVTDPQRSGTPTVLTMDQTGAVTLNNSY